MAKTLENNYSEVINGLKWDNAVCRLLTSILQMQDLVSGALRTARRMMNESERANSKAFASLCQLSVQLDDAFEVLNNELNKEN